jgi:hypothetical protein
VPCFKINFFIFDRMESLDNLTTSVDFKMKSGKITQSELEQLVSKEAFKVPIESKPVNLTQLSKIKLEEMLDKQKTLIQDKKLLATLPDKGERIKRKINEIESQLAQFNNQQAASVDNLSNILGELKIVEKRPTAKFFKNKEIENSEKKDQKFHSHRNEKFNKISKENQPIKTLKIDEEREAHKMTLNRISEAEKARQLATLASREKIPILLETEAKWRDRFDDEDEIEIPEEEEEEVQTGFEAQQNI